MTPYPSNCAVSAEEWMIEVQALLPKGPAWQAASTPGTTMYAFWYAVASVCAWIESILCGFYNELFCASASDTLPEWQEDYGVDPTDPNEPWPVLCNKLSFVGGQTADVFTGLAAQHGFDITLDRAAQATYQASRAGANNVSGCMTAGRALMLTDAPLNNCGAPCAYGPASAYPDPGVLIWGSDRSTVTCPVPGSSLGQGAGCMIAGAYSTPAVSAPQFGADYVGPCAYIPRVIFPIPNTPALSCPPRQAVRIPGPTAQIAVNVSTSGSQSGFDSTYAALGFLNKSNVRPAHAAFVFSTVA